jgi:DNA-binding MarR family transcriptional regulator
MNPASHSPDQQVDSLADDLRVALMRVVRRVRAEKADDDLSDSQYGVLAFLDRHGPATPGALAEFERVRPPSMTRTIAALADLGLVARDAHPDDGRQVLVRLTEPGRATVHDTRVRRNVWLADRLAALDPAERAALATAADVLRRIAAE